MQKRQYHMQNTKNQSLYIMKIPRSNTPSCKWFWFYITWILEYTLHMHFNLLDASERSWLQIKKYYQYIL